MNRRDKKTAIQSAQLKQLFSASNLSLITSTCLAAILAYIQQEVISPSVVLTWLSLIMLVAFARAVLVKAYQRSTIDDDTATQTWLLRFRLGVIAVGAVWGAAGFLLFPAGNSQYQIFLIFMLAGMSAGGVVAFSADLISAVVFSVLVVLPLAFRLLFVGDSLSIAMAVALMLYLGFMVMSLRHINRHICENIVLRIEAVTREAKVRASEERYRLLLSHLPVGIFHYDTNLAVTYCNNRLADMLNSSIDRILGQDVKLTRSQPVISALKAALQGEVGYYEGYYRATFSDAEGWMCMTCAPFRDTDGNIVGGITIVQDFTERKQIEAATLLAKEHAEALTQSKSEFLANMSHEIRTPMNAIIGLSQLALNQEVSGEVRDYLHKINISSENLLGILNDILDFSKVEAGKLSIEHTRFNLDTILDNLHNLFSVRALEKNLAFHIKVAPGTPSDLVGDALRIQQVLSNLMGNAIKFTEQGNVTLQVQLLERVKSQARIRFSMSDTGIGIEQEDQAKLFQPFTQADSSITRRFGGSGLGLTISDKLLRLMGSDFHVTSTPGQGTTFSFELMLHITSPGLYPETNRRHAERRAGMLTKELREQGEMLKGTRILVAEDNVINQLVVKEFLKLCRVTVDIANNGIEALHLLEQNTYDAVLMDVHMPEMGGVEATENIRQQEHFKHLPVIALTAGVTQEERDNCQASGMNDFIAKPIVPEKLISVLCHWIGKAGGTASIETTNNNSRD